MNIDLSKTDRNCIFHFFFRNYDLIFSLLFLVLGCIGKRKVVDPVPTKRKRTSSRMNL